MSIYVLFPGQGAQVPGMGLDFLENYGVYREAVETASRISGKDLYSVFRDKELLDKTENSQIAIFTMGFGIISVLREKGIVPDAFMGLSLGEYGALASSGAFTFEDGVRLLVKRSEAMQKACDNTEGFLAAVSFFQSDLIEKALEGRDGLWVSNYNAPSQTVCGGLASRKEEFEAALKEAGAKKITFLNVSGAFHTELMAEAGKEFRSFLDGIEMKTPEAKVLSNYKGTFYEEGDDFRDILEKHIYCPVRLVQSFEALDAKDGDIFIQVGPGKALASLANQNKVKGSIFSVDSISDMEALLKELDNAGGAQNG